MHGSLGIRILEITGRNKMDEIKGEINLSKKLTPEIPFYSVSRSRTGTVIHCAKLVGYELHCPTCMFSKNCLCKAGGI
jgi:hypothetical protein